MYRKSVSNIVEKKLCVVCGSDLNCKMLGFPSWYWNSAATLSKLSELEKKHCNNWNRFVEKFKRNEWNDIMGVKKPFYQYKVPLELDSWIKLTFMSSYHMYGPGFNGLFDHDSGHSFIWKHTVEKSQIFPIRGTWCFISRLRTMRPTWSRWILLQLIFHTHKS